MLSSRPYAQLSLLAFGFWRVRAIVDTGPVAPILWASAVPAPTAMGLLSLSKTVADAWVSLMLEDE